MSTPQKSPCVIQTQGQQEAEGIQANTSQKVQSNLLTTRLPNYPEYGNIPHQLKEKAHWVVWMSCPKLDKFDAKPDKLPLQAQGGQMANIVNPTHWGTFAQAQKFAESHFGQEWSVAARGGTRTGIVSGIGFVLTKELNITGIDLDDCFHSSVGLKPWAKDILSRLDTYTEISPSGKGIRAFVLGEMPEKGNRTLGIEMYDDKRYLTVTGHSLPEYKGKGIRSAQSALNYVHTTYLAVGKEHQASDTSPWAKLDLDAIPTLTETQIEERLGKAKASANGVAITSLLADGNDGSYQSDSEADQALCNHLAFWLNKDPVAIFAVIKNSALMRDKWKRDDYAKRTIHKAISDTRNTYSEPVSSPAVPEASSPKQHTLLTVSQYLEQPKIEYLVDGLFPREGIGSVYGGSGVGKTFFILDLAASVATGLPWFERPTKQTPVVYILAEGSLRSRIPAWEANKNIKLKDNFFILQDGFRMFGDNTDVHDLIPLIPEGSLVVVDTLNQVTSGADENSAKDMGMIIYNAKLIQQRTKGLVILIAHSGKDKGKAIRGHSSLMCALDVAIEVRRTANIHSWKLIKAKEAEDGIEYNFSLVKSFYEVGKGECDSSLVVNQNEYMQPDFKPLTKSEQVALDSLKNALGCNKFVDVTTWKKSFYKIHSEKTPDANRKAFDRARDALIKKDAVIIDNSQCRMVLPH